MTVSLSSLKHPSIFSRSDLISMSIVKEETVPTGKPMIDIAQQLSAALSKFGHGDSKKKKEIKTSTKNEKKVVTKQVTEDEEQEDVEEETDQVGDDQDQESDRDETLLERSRLYRSRNRRSLDCRDDSFQEEV
jgi:hypothetical protein